jgi:hypothetical protein
VYTIASQDGGVNSGFFLQFRPDTAGGHWVFGMPNSDGGRDGTDTVASIRAIDSTHAWVHVTGVYNAFTRRLQTQVSDSFGVARQYAGRPKIWNAAGPVQVGRDLDDSAYQDLLPGVLDDIRVYAGVLPPAALDELAR